MVDTKQQIEVRVEERLKKLRKKLKKEQSYDKTKTVVEEYLSLLLLKEIYYERK